MQLYLIEIHWSRRKPMPGMPTTGVTIARTRSANLAKASIAAANSFKRKWSAIYQITKVTEQQDPAGLFEETVKPVISDCGSGQDYGICQVCGQGHGHVVMSSGQ